MQNLVDARDQPTDTPDTDDVMLLASDIS